MAASETLLGEWFFVLHLESQQRHQPVVHGGASGDFADGVGCRFTRERS